jgi:uncharacterized membrane protein
MPIVAPAIRMGAAGGKNRMSLLIRPVIRVVLAILLAGAVFLLLPSDTWELRMIAAWNAGAMLLLTLIAIMMAGSDPEETCRRTRHQEPSNSAMLLMTLLTSLAGYIAIGVGLRTADDMTRRVLGVHTVLSITGVFSAWLLVHTYFALHYAKCYYDETSDANDGSFKKGLQFPGDKLVDYWDFMYYSFTIAMCYQTSDVSVISPIMRRLTLVHSIVSFFFVLVGLGLMVNIISKFISN